MDNLKQYYKQLGIDEEVYDFCSKIEAQLKDRFERIDRTAECNQLKVLQETSYRYLMYSLVTPHLLRSSLNLDISV